MSNQPREATEARRLGRLMETGNYDEIPWDELDEPALRLLLQQWAIRNGRKLSELQLPQGTPLQDWADTQNARLEAAIARAIEPITAVSAQVEEMRDYVAEVLDEQARTNHRRTALFCGWVLFLGTLWVQVGYPLLKLGKQAVTTTQEAPQAIAKAVTGEAELDKLSCIQMAKPSSGQITSGFGQREAPQTAEGSGSSDHKGLDISAGQGSPVLAAAAGKVTHAGDAGDGYGESIVIYHGTVGGQKIEALYGHNEKLLVKAGDLVSQGQPIAEEGSTGKSTGPHLHFGVLVNGEYVNPEEFLDKQWGEGCPGKQ